MRVRLSRAKPIIRFSPLPELINNLLIRIIPNLYPQLAFCELFPDRLSIHLVGLRYVFRNGAGSVTDILKLEAAQTIVEVTFPKEPESQNQPLGSKDMLCRIARSRLTFSHSILEIPVLRAQPRLALGSLLSRHPHQNMNILAALW